ncbi:Protein cwh43 [Hypsizygus marmoreus]|uniref:Protein cwh43 n=1 Tax=Hypsizygus marmoreus TaxID=39966 RepID=A0A369KEF2_HYPMA|nr:Protein cwh43 [Hypsizygus marmoreus]
MATKPQLNASKVPPPPTPFTVSAALVGRVHTVLAYTAFLTALVVGCLGHYKKIVKNDVAGYPQEWFPSVSATIGDWYPERNIFQIFIALTSGPRFALVFFQYHLHRAQAPTSALPAAVFVFGIIRTLSCGGWVYITSSDDHDVHDVLMITYMVCNIPWMGGGIACTPAGDVRRRRIFVATAFFVSLVPLVYFFIQHKVHRIPGAYTHYSFFEWGLIFFDVLYDAVAEQEFREADLQISLGPTLGAAGVENTSHSEQITTHEPKASLSEDNGSVGEDTSSAETIDAPQPSFALTSIISPNWRPTISFLSDVYLSYVFWSIFTSLIPTLFYFSVWELGIAGHELALFTTLSPVLLGIPPLLRWARTRGGQMALGVLELAGLAAYRLESPGDRLAVVAGATTVLVMRRVVLWAGEDVGYQSVLMGLGLLVHSLSKHLNHGNNPVWPFVNETSGGYNKTGILLSLLAIYETYTRSPPAKPTHSQHTTPTKQTPRTSAASTAKQHWLAAAFPLGSLLFTLHNLLSDPSTLIAWSWTGYQSTAPRGPVPHLHGSLTLVAQCVGLLLPIVLSSSSSSPSASVSETQKPTPHPTLDPLSHPLWFAYGAASAYVMYTYRDWVGYIGGLNLAVFVMSIVPLVMRVETEGRVGKIYGGAFGVYCVLNLASIFTVAYAFVPGGVYLRERTDCVLFAQMAALALAFRWPYAKTRVTAHNQSPITTPATESRVKTMLAFVAVSSVLGTLYRYYPSVPPRPFKPGPRVFNAGIWTLHFGIDNTGRDSQRGVVRVLRDMELDVVGFLETDLHRTAFGHRDLTRVAVEELGYYVDVGPGPNSHTWGAVLLSKFPIINSTHHLLPSPRGELAPAIEAVLDVFGTEITVVVSHNGQEEDPLDRELQSKELGRIMAASYPKPLVFLGYVVTKPGAEKPAPYKFLVEDGRMYDIEEEDQDRWCEYILYRGLYRTAYARLSRGTITDTEMQIGQFTLPKHGVGVTNETRTARYLRSFKEKLPQHHWFPMAYYGHESKGGVNGHYYHVFGTPLYYDFPEGAVL